MSGITQIRVVSVRVEEGVHPLDEKFEQEIAQNWEQKTCANPALFDGEFYLTVSVSVNNGCLEGVYRRTSFATFLYWRRRPADHKDVFHIFSAAAMITKDNKIVAGRMAGHTEIAGQVCIPAGSIDDNDIAESMADYEGCMMRETREETGIELHLDQANDQYNLIEIGGYYCLIREFRMDMSSQELIGQIEQNLSQMHQSELDRIYAFGPGEIHGQMLKYLQTWQKCRK